MGPGRVGPHPPHPGRGEQPAQRDARVLTFPDRARPVRIGEQFPEEPLPGRPDEQRPAEGGEGLEVVSVSDESSAPDAGIVAGDVILLIDKEAVGSREDLVAKLRDKNPGDVMSVTILRDAEEQLLYVTLKGAA